MHYIKLKSEGTVIEFHNNWLGEETVIVGGKMVSKKSSIMGANHYFTVVEKGATVNYILTSKVLDSLMNVGIDLIRNGQMVYENVPLSYGNKTRTPHEELKSKALAKLLEYDVHEALDLLKKAQQLDPEDYEVYFHLACAYSNLEDAENGYENLKLAVQHGMNDFEKILNHDMLAFLRLQDPFERFQESGFTEY
jgi:Flp pilus assembly protein TadD